MLPRFRSHVIAGALALALSAPSWADTLYDESVSGDLSNSGLAPTALTFGAGANVVRGTTGNAGGIDRDYFTFTVPTGMAWVSLTLLPGSAVIGGSSFIGVQAGPQVTVSPTGGTASGLLGWTLYGDGDAGNDLLPIMSSASLGSSGFTIPLGAGSYAVWVQEMSAGTTPYGFAFQLTPVPEAPAAALLAGGLALLAWRRRRRG